MIELLITLGITIATILHAKYDAKLWEEGKYINHSIRAVLRFLLIALVSMLINPYTWIHYGLFIAVQCAWFWIVFDIGINAFRGFYILSIGATANTDKFLQLFKSEYYALFFKFALLMGLIFGYILYFDSLN